ncbi:MAG: response regulator [Planctomycetes bacterium]|nr:response regulator [Planctomycetota bacterium]
MTTNGRILIVEDESLVAEDLYWHLRRAGYDVVGIADSVEMARRIAAADNPDLALLDIRLKGVLDGIDLAAELRRLGIGFIYLTSYADEGTLSRATVTEPLGYVLKPFGPREVLPVVRTAMFRHNAELRLRNMEQWLQMTLRSIGDGVVVTDRWTSITFVNAAAERLLGREAKDLIGKPLASRLVLRRPGVDGDLACVAGQAMQAGEAVFLPPDVELVRPDGSVVAIEDCASPIRDDGGDVSGVVLVLQDASERRQLEKARLESERRLQHARRLESLGTLAGGLAHDMNNILTAILGNVALCREPRGAPVAEALQEIELNAKAAADLCHRMLLGSGMAEPVRAPLDAVAVVVDCITRENALAPAGVQFATRFAFDTVSVLADAVQFRQVLQNLLRNAVEAVSPRGGRIEVTVDTVVVEGGAAGQIGERLPGAFARIEVRDDGPGMADTVKAHVFEPFFSTKFTGRGLGLASVHGIVGRHGGAIEVDSWPGAGTTMRVLWPLAPEHLPPAPAATAASAGPTVLIVDDDDAVRDVTRRMLAGRGYRCHVASGGAEALRLLADGLQVDLAVVDIVMPGMTGYEVMQGLRQHRPGLPVVMVSGLAETEGGRFVDEDVPVVAKPVAIGDLIAQIEARLGRR